MDRVLLYVREARGEREVFRFSPLTARPHLDRVTEDAVAGHLSGHVVTDRGTASVSTYFRAAPVR